MRTKNGKLPGPAPIGLAVFALAALLSIGLLVGNGAATAQAQDMADCVINKDDSNPPVGKEITSTASSGDCTVTGVAEVEFTGKATAGADDDVVYHIYANGKITATGAGTLPQRLVPPGGSDAVSFDYVRLEIQQAIDDGVSPKARKARIMVSPRTGANRVTIYAYAGIGPNDRIDQSADPKELNPAHHTEEIRFLGGPARVADATADPLVYRSKVDVYAGDGDTPPAEIDKTSEPVTSVTLIGDGATAATVWVNVRDKDDSNLSGKVTFVAVSEPASAYGTGRAINRTLVAGAALFKLTGLPTDTHFRITVTATYDDGTSDGFELGVVTIERPGPLHEISAELCAEDMTNRDATDGCGRQKKPQMVYSATTTPLSIVVSARDGLGSDPQGVVWTSEVPDAAEDFITIGAFEDDPLSATVTIDDDETVSGIYELKLKATQDRGAAADIEMERTVTLIIPGDLVKYTLEGPDRILIGDRASYTVSALDANDVQAKITEANKRVSVVVSPRGLLMPDHYVLLGGETDADLTTVEFDPGVDGGHQKSFDLYVKGHAERGSLIITVLGPSGLSVGEVSKTIHVGPNTAPVAGTVTPPMLTADGGPVTVDSALSDPDGDVLTYTAMSSDDTVATVTVDANGMVTIVPVGEGTVTITVTGTDPGGATVTQTIPITVGAANNPPMAVGTIPLQSLVAGAGVSAVDVSDAFSDPDGDTLTYTAMSSDAAVAAVSVSGASVNILPVAAGIATITVTANDGGTQSATQAFAVTVAEAVRLIASYQLEGPDRILPGVTGTYTVTARDANGMAPTINADNSTVSVLLDGDADVLADVTLLGVTNGELTLNSTGVGSFRIVARRSAGHGAITVDVFGVSGVDRVSEIVRIGANQPPTAGATIAEQTLTIGDAPVTVATNFSDADDDALTYAVTSSDEMVATATVAADGMVTITAVAVGAATITVTATDADGSAMSATQEIAVTVISSELGDATALTATPGANAGEVQLSWTAGAQAELYRVAWINVFLEVPSAGVPFTTDDSVTYTATGLESGVDYWFSVVSLRGEGNDREFGLWHEPVRVTVP